MVVLGVLLFAPPIMRDGITAVGWTLIPYCAALLLVAVFCAYRVTVDWRGLRVTSLLFSIPLKRIHPDQIAAVEAATLEPMQWGGGIPDHARPLGDHPPQRPRPDRHSAKRETVRDQPRSARRPTSILLGLIPASESSADAQR